MQNALESHRLKPTQKGLLDESRFRAYVTFTAMFDTVDPPRRFSGAGQALTQSKISVAKYRGLLKPVRTIHRRREARLPGKRVRLEAMAAPLRKSTSRIKRFSVFEPSLG